MVFAQQARFNRYREVHGLKTIRRRLARRNKPSDIAEREKAIGPAWSYVLRDSKSFSGLSVADLAKMMHARMYQWYVAIYSLQSGMTHGASALMHLKKIDDETIAAAFLSDDREIRPVLQCSTALFLIFMALMNEQIGFGVGAVTAWHGLQREADDLYG